MEYIFFAIGVFGLAWTGSVCWHLLTDDDVFELVEFASDFDYVRCSLVDCHHPDVGQSGECERCGANIEIGVSE